MAEAAIRLVLLDVGGTLVEPQPSGRELIVRTLSGHGHRVSVEDVREAEAAAQQAVAELLPMTRYGTEESRLLWGRFNRALVEALGIEDDGTIGANLYSRFQQPSNWGLFGDVLPALRELRSSGYRLGVVSNWEDWLEDLLLALELHPMFEAIVASGPFGYAKPHPAIFHQALHLAGCSADEVVYVGDSPQDDVDGARNAGIRPILLDRRGRHADLNVPRISSLAELPAILRRPLTVAS